jgi:SnoaL-like domain
MESSAARDLFARWLHALNTHDMETVRALAHPDFEDFYPQSGELTRGVANLEAIITNYPGELEGLGRDRIIGGEEKFVRSPLFTIIRVEGNDEVLTGIQRARYPDGSIWFIIVVGELREGKVYRTQSLFAPAFDAPEWRAQWVEIRSGGDE